MQKYIGLRLPWPVSIHAPVGGGDQVRRGSVTFPELVRFNPRPRGGGDSQDRVNNELRRSMEVSIHAPVGGATMAITCLAIYRRHGSFNPRPRGGGDEQSPVIDRIA